MYAILDSISRATKVPSAFEVGLESLMACIFLLHFFGVTYCGSYIHGFLMRGNPSEDPQLTSVLSLLHSLASTVLSHICGPYRVDIWAPAPKDWGHIVMLLVEIDHCSITLGVWSSLVFLSTGAINVSPNPLYPALVLEHPSLQASEAKFLKIIAITLRIYTLMLVIMYIFCNHKKDEGLCYILVQTVVWGRCPDLVVSEGGIIRFIQVLCIFFCSWIFCIAGIGQVITVWVGTWVRDNT